MSLSYKSDSTVLNVKNNNKKTIVLGFFAERGGWEIKDNYLMFYIRLV